MPCADKDQIGSFEKITTIHNAKQHHDKDACSPLCVCNCCGCQGFAYNAVYYYNFVSIKTIIDNKIPQYKSILTSNFYGSIWQPPQITA